MADYSIDFLGCKISQTDAEAIGDALAHAGHAAAGEGARIRVVNTCCITAEAEKKSRKKVRQLARSGDDVHVFVTGCGASLRPEAYADLGERVTALPGAASLAAQQIVREADRLAGLACKGAASTSAASRRTRAFVKIQDGCSFLCSYCIVPTVRGDTRSRSTEAVLRDVRRRVAMGQREIVLTGINIGLFRDPDTRAGLPQLLLEVADVEGVARVRISSIEVNHVNRRLVSAMASHPKVCPHLHVPLQSGDDGVLREMRRNYTADRYLRAIDHARSELPDINLTTDVIIGFPNEDDAAFAQTMRVARDAGFTKVHAFPFSPRPGTDAEQAHDPVPPAVKKQRSQQLRVQADGFARDRWRARLGSIDDVIAERSSQAAGGMTLTAPGQGSGDDRDASPRPPAGLTLAVGPSGRGAAGELTGLRGYTRDYCPVRLVGSDVEDGAHVRVRLEHADADGLVARVIAPYDGA